MKITSPTMVLDKVKCLKNIERMVKKAKEHNLEFRPHFKSHQSVEIGGWFRDFGVRAITVSSLRMADYFASGGFDDITVAFPANLNEMGLINDLAKKISLNLLVESAETAAALGRGLDSRVGVFIKVDTGYGRTGIAVRDFQTVERVADEIGKSPKLCFKGFLTHAGHSYSAKTTGEILAIHSKSVSQMFELKDFFVERWPDAEISVGDTPCCSLAADFPGVTEIRPGNFVFYDTMQLGLGSCTHDQIAVALACPVVAKHADRNSLVIHGGAVHLSKESLTAPTGERRFGLMVRLGEEGWSAPVPDALVVGLSQEHGVLSVPEDEFQRIKVGEIIGILPVHSCLTANLMRGYLTLSGEIVDHMQGRGVAM